MCVVVGGGGVGGVGGGGGSGGGVVEVVACPVAQNTKRGNKKNKSIGQESNGGVCGVPVLLEY